MRGRESVEGADGGGEGVEDVEVGLEAVVDEFAEVFFVRGAVFGKRGDLVNYYVVYGGSIY